MPWIDKCLGSMIQSGYPTDILVLDNDSKDETVKTIRERYPQVKLIENHANLGFGKANNIGILLAIKEGYDAVLLLNEDAWLDTNTLERLAKVSLDHPEYGIISPIHLTGNGDKPEKGFATYTGIQEISGFPDTDIVQVPFIDAAIWMIRTDVLKKTGLFAPIFYHYGEDKDMANRMAYYHYKIGYVPSVFGYHDREISKLYVRSITVTVLVSLVLCLPIIVGVIDLLVQVMMSQYSGNLEIWIAPQTYAIEVLIGAATYAVVALLHMRRIRRVPLALAMKVQE